MKQPEVSVIVPVYKTEKYLDECMKSLLAQTLHDMEIVLVDDESPDGCPGLCDAYAAADPRVKVVHKKNGGLGYARNSGLEVATGRYVAFLDSDDYVHPDTYRAALELMEARGLDMVRFSCNRFTDSGESTSEAYDGEAVFYEGPDDITRLTLSIFQTGRRDNLRYDIGGSSCMALYRLDIIRDNALRFHSERELISEDFRFNFDYYGHITKAAYLPRTYYHYRVSPDSLTQRLNLDGPARAEKFSRHMAEAFRERGYGEEARSYALGYYINALRVYSKSVFLSSMPRREKKEWFDAVTSGSYLQEECAGYPMDVLPLKQQLVFKAMRGRHFTLAYILISGYSKIRKDSFK